MINHTLIDSLKHVNSLFLKHVNLFTTLPRKEERKLSVTVGLNLKVNSKGRRMDTRT